MKTFFVPSERIWLSDIINTSKLILKIRYSTVKVLGCDFEHPRECVNGPQMYSSHGAQNIFTQDIRNDTMF